MILLDTQLIAEALIPLEDTKAQEWLDQQHPETLFLSEISLTELKQSLRSISDTRESKKVVEASEKLAKKLKSLFGDRILAFDEKAIAALAQVEANSAKSKIQLSLIDSMIAAIALAHDFQIASRNITTFQAAGVKVINPWEI